MKPKLYSSSSSLSRSNSSNVSVETIFHFVNLDSNVNVEWIKNKKMREEPLQNNIQKDNLLKKDRCLGYFKLIWYFIISIGRFSPKYNK